MDIRTLSHQLQIEKDTNTTLLWTLVVAIVAIVVIYHVQKYLSDNGYQ